MKVILILVDEESEICFNKEHEIWRDNLPGRKILQERGIIFPRHYTNTTACSPSRATLYSGRYPKPGLNNENYHDVTWVNGIASDEFPALKGENLGSILRKHGWQSKYIGKWHLCPHPTKEKLEEYGWDTQYWSGKEPHGPDLDLSGIQVDPETFQSAKTAIREMQDKDFLAINFVQPHDINLYIQLKALGLLPAEVSESKYPSVLCEADSEIGEFPLLDQTWKRYQDNEIFQPKEITESYFDLEEYRRFYLWCCETVDGYVAELMKMIDKNTIVIFTSDHGSQYGTRGGLLGKWLTVNERVMRVPMIMVIPGLKPNDKAVVKYPYLSSHVDILPTLLGRLEISHKLPGVNLLTEERKEVFFVSYDNPTRGQNQLRLFERLRGGDPYPYKEIEFFGISCVVNSQGEKKVRLLREEKQSKL